jgi:hypothetical protein
MKENIVRRAVGSKVQLPPESMKGDFDIAIRAINADNRRDVERLVHLLTSYYGAGHSFDGVYDTEYLLAQVEELDAKACVMSLVAELNEQFVAHIALRFDHGKKSVELLFPAIRPEQMNRLIDISHAFWSRIGELADKQNWELIYQYSPVSESALQIISAKFFESHDMALFPDVKPVDVSSSAFRRLQTFSLMYHVFSASSEKQKYLYPPAKHGAKVEELLGPARHNRVVIKDVKKVSAIQTPQFREEPVLVGYREIPGIHEITIAPDKLDDRRETLEYLREFAARGAKEGSRVCVKVAMENSSCPSFCSDLESIGFRFCGVSPFIDNRDYILYTTFGDDSLLDAQLFTPRGRALRDYLLRSNGR